MLETWLRESKVRLPTIVMLETRLREISGILDQCPACYAMKHGRETARFDPEPPKKYFFIT